MALEGIRFGVFAAAIGADARALARTSRELGFAGLQFDAISAAIDLTELSGSGRREFLRLLSSQDQQLVGLRTDVGPKGFGPGSDIDRVLARLEKVMETAAGLASPLVSVELGSLPAATRTVEPRPAVTALEAGLILLPESATQPPPPPPPAPPADPNFVSQVASALAELGRRADRYSVVLALRSELSSFASLEQALRQADCPWFGVDLDPVSLLRDEWDTDELFTRLGPLVRHVRCRDAVVGADRRTKAAVVGQGSVPWEALLANLDETGYQGWATLDSSDVTDRAGAARAGLKYLQSLLS